MEEFLELNKDKEKIKVIAESLANEKRLEMLDVIRNNDGLSHKELAEKLGITSGTVSFHISYLLDAGLIYEDLGKGLLGKNKKMPKIKTKKITVIIGEENNNG
ncbi:MAG: winged helix-turn-helix domain-containing protein [Candidatus Odinarchaeia archaeon]